MDIFYFKNNATNKVFISFDEMNLINPKGKRIELNEDLFFSCDNCENELSEIQKEIIKIEKNRPIEVEKKEECYSFSYKGCEVSRSILNKIQNKEIVLLVCFGRKYSVIDIKDIDSSDKYQFKKEVEKRCNEYLLKVLRIKNQRSTRYRIIYWSDKIEK